MSQTSYPKRLIKRKNLEGVVISKPDTILKTVVYFLVAIGIIMIFSSSSPKCIQEGVNPASFAIKQFVAAIIGLFLMRFFTNFDYRRLFPLAIPFAWLVVFLLFLVKFTPLGVEVNNAKRWMSIAGFQFQPSEMAKLSTIMLLACAFYNNTILFDNEKIMKYFLPIILMILFIFAQPNLSMVMLLVITSIAMYICAGGSWRFLFFFIVMGIIVLKLKMRKYQLGRLKIWLNPETDPLGAGYNIIQSLIAFAVGGFTGVGYGNSKQKLFWLPECHTDFIFAVFAEEFGFIGCLFVIGLFATFMHRGFIISSNCNDMFGKLIALGITISIGMQAFINMAVSSAMIPATGVPMPFISYGNTSLIVSMCMVGILLNISKKRLRSIKNY